MRRPRIGAPAANSRRTPWVKPMMRPEPSSVTADSGSTSRNSGLDERRSTQSCRFEDIRFAISIRRAAALTRLMARFWLVLGEGARSSEMSSTAESRPAPSWIGAAVQDSAVWAFPK